MSSSPDAPAVARVPEGSTVPMPDGEPATEAAPEGPLLGFLAIRHELNRYLFDRGGHIGYSVRPTWRRRGIARAALRQGLAECAARGLDPVLVTCAVDNVASRGVLESSGGAFEGTRYGARRFWFGEGPRPTSPTTRAAGAGG